VASNIVVSCSLREVGPTAGPTGRRAGGSRAAYRRLINLGFADAYMQSDGRAHQYSFWDYQAGAWPKDHGIRIDHILLSPQAADRLTETVIHRTARGLEKPSDHVPVIAALDL
jgi:exodeoxyribonuclease-3